MRGEEMVATGKEGCEKEVDVSKVQPRVPQSLWSASSQSQVYSFKRTTKKIPLQNL